MLTNLVSNIPDNIKYSNMEDGPCSVRSDEFCDTLINKFVTWIPMVLANDVEYIQISSRGYINNIILI